MQKSGNDHCMIQDSLGSLVRTPSPFKIVSMPLLPTHWYVQQNAYYITMARSVMQLLHKVVEEPTHEYMQLTI